MPSSSKKPVSQKRRAPKKLRGGEGDMMNEFDAQGTYRIRPDPLVELQKLPRPPTIKPATVVRNFDPLADKNVAGGMDSPAKGSASVAGSKQSGGKAKSAQPKKPRASRKVVRGGANLIAANGDFGPDSFKITSCKDTAPVLSATGSSKAAQPCDQVQKGGKWKAPSNSKSKGSASSSKSKSTPAKPRAPRRKGMKGGVLDLELVKNAGGVVQERDYLAESASYDVAAYHYESPFAKTSDNMYIKDYRGSPSSLFGVIPKSSVA